MKTQSGVDIVDIWLQAFLIRLHLPAALRLWKETQVPIGQEAGWALELAWTQWQKKINKYVSVSVTLLKI